MTKCRLWLPAVGLIAVLAWGVLCGCGKAQYVVCYTAPLESGGVLNGYALWEGRLSSWDDLRAVVKSLEYGTTNNITGHIIIVNIYRVR